MAGYSIGSLAAETGVSRATIRYYEQIGLLEPGLRTAAGYRRFSAKTLVELNFVRRAQTFGYTLEEIREFLRLHRRGQSPCANIVATAQRRLADVDREIIELTAFRDRLAETIGGWTTNPTTPQPCDLTGPCALITCETPCACPSARAPEAPPMLGRLAPRSGRRRPA